MVEKWTDSACVLCNCSSEIDLFLSVFFGVIWGLNLLVGNTCFLVCPCCIPVVFRMVTIFAVALTDLCLFFTVVCLPSFGKKVCFLTRLSLRSSDGAGCSFYGEMFLTFKKVWYATAFMYILWNVPDDRASSNRLSAKVIDGVVALFFHSHDRSV